MGSGKTIIALTLALLYREESLNKAPALIVVSKSLISVWVGEILKFFDDKIPFHVIHHEKYCSDVLNCDINRFHILITTPETMRKHYKHYNVESRMMNLDERTLYYSRPNNPIGDKSRGMNPIYGTIWSSFFIDEADKFLNPDIQTTRSMMFVCSDHRWLLSGTIFSEPSIDKIFGYYLLLNDPQTPRSKPDFLRKYNSSNYKGVKRTVVKRKINEDYIPSELGQKIHDVVVTHDLGKEEAEFFLKIKGIINILYTRIEELKGVKEQILVLEAKMLRGMILGMITYIRESLVCPLIPITSMMLKMSNLESRDRVVLSFIRELVNVNKEWLDDENSVFSSRLKKVVEIVDIRSKENIVIFSSFRSTLDVLKFYLPDGRPVFTINSSHSSNKRFKIISEWENTGGAILLLTYSIGSCGLNLQKGNVAIIMDYGWDVDVTNQGVARIIRRGQEHTELFVYYLTSNTGIENALYKMHETKSLMCQEIQDGKMMQDKKKLKLKDIINLINMEDNYSMLSKFYSTEKKEEDNEIVYIS
jgi:SNF2 family DNA or RNA helicase